MSYFTSIIVWLFINFGLTVVLKDQIMENGWVTEEDIEKAKKEGVARGALKCVMFCAIPIYRFLLALAMIYMSNIKKGDSGLV